MKKTWIIIAWLVAGLLSVTACAGPASISTSTITPLVTLENTPKKTPTASSPASVPISQAKGVDKAMVQIWESDQFVASGIVVGDGSQILTVLNYEVSTTSNLEVVIPGRGHYPATIQGLDARTRATLLKIEGVKLPVISVGDGEAVLPGQRVFLNDWYLSSTGVTPGEPILRQTPVMVGSPYPDLPLWINLQMTEEMKKESPFVQIAHGAVLTDDSGRVIGLDLGMTDEFFYAISPGANPPFSIPRAIKINSALDLLSPDASTQPWANGPLEFIVVNNLATAMRSGGSIQNYSEATAAIAEVLNWMGSPISNSDWPQYELNTTSPTQVVTLTVVYPRPVNLLNNEGEILAQAKWVGIQWALPGSQLDRVYYGNKGGTVLGGFIINGDLSNLEKLIDSLAYHAP